MSRTKLAGKGQCLGIPGFEKIAASTVIIVMSLEDYYKCALVGR